MAVVAVSAPAVAEQDKDQLVTAAQSTFADFQHDPDMTWFRANVGRAKGVLIAPQIVKAGWIFGGRGGRCCRS
jgi:lipid-binding SYLF domain-containing protein